MSHHDDETYDETYDELARKAAKDGDHQASIAYSLIHQNQVLAGLAIPLVRISRAQQRAYLPEEGPEGRPLGNG